MKTNSTLATLLATLIISVLSIEYVKASQTIEFITLGNCYLCKVRIEDALEKLPGAEEYSWSIMEKITEVTYDDAQTDPYEIMLAIAAVGHDTEWYAAPDFAYNQLIGTCCEYERTIDYTEVQIGYLSLMDIWVTELTGILSVENSEINIYPTISNGLYTIDFNTFNRTEELNISVFTMSGQEVFDQKAEFKNEFIVDLRSMGNGQYILIISDHKEILSRYKLIKN